MSESEKTNMSKEKANVKANSFDIIGGKDVMPIGGFFGPYPHEFDLPEYITDECFKMIAETGTNLIAYSMMDYSENVEESRKHLDLAAKYNMGVFVQDKRITEAYGEGEVNKEEVQKNLAEYSEHPAFCGLYLVDEPYTEYYLPREEDYRIARFANIGKYLHDELNVLTYGDLFCIYDVEKYREPFERYVEEWMESIHPKVLIWNYYPYDHGYAYNEGYFWDMCYMRKTAQQYGIPFWGFIQAGGRWREGDPYVGTDDYHPNEGEFNWNVNTTLAFGVKGILYFPLIEPQSYAYMFEEKGDFLGSGLIGAVNNKTQWFYFAKNINKHIAVIDEVLMNAESKGIVVSGDAASRDLKNIECVITSGTYNELLSVEGDALIGCFDCNNKTALYVVNYDREHAGNITLKFNGTYNINIVKNAEESCTAADSITVEMAAGEGVLVVID